MSVDMDMGLDQSKPERESHLIKLPVELRLSIYDFALLDSPAVTIGHAEVVGAHYDVVHRLYGEGRKPFPGLPQHHEPLIKSYYDLSLLSITNPPVVLANAPLNTHHYSTHQSLLLVNRQINGELTSHFNLPRNRRTSVFASFPYGLYILKKTAPRLLHQAQSIHIAGKYSPSDFIPERAACTGEHHPHIPIKHHGNFAPNSSELLGQLIAATFGPVPIYHVRKFEMRVYYPGDDSYSTVWGDDSSPTVVALRNICNAEVGIEVWRGRYGTGIYLCATPTTERKRVVSTVWRKLEEGRRDQPGCGSWVVDPKWPKWEQDYGMSDGPRGDVITSVATSASES